MKNAILLFHASQLGDNIHPFLSNEIGHFAKTFDNIFVFCLKPRCTMDALKQFKNVRVITISLRKLYSRLWLLVPELVSKYFWNDLKIALRNKIFDTRYLKITAMEIIYGRYFSRIANKLIAQYPNATWVIDSYWLAETAYAAARIKMNNKRIIAFSRLHSSEADVERNRYSICQLKGFLDKYLDFIFFVSEKGRDNYFEILKKHYNKDCITDSKYIVNRLGVKASSCQNNQSADGIFRIVSCSRMVPLKRVKLLADVFSYWDGKPVEWTHIGTGEEYVIVKTIIEGSSKTNVTYNLLGDMPNEKVMEYYASNPIDLFINVSEFEGLPVSVMEALSYGIPVIATDVGGTRELINSTNGRLLNKNITVDAVSDAIKQIIDIPNSEKKVMRQNAYNTYLEKLLSDENFEKLLTYIGL